MSFTLSWKMATNEAANMATMARPMRTSRTAVVSKTSMPPKMVK